MNHFVKNMFAAMLGCILASAIGFAVCGALLGGVLSIASLSASSVKEVSDNSVLVISLNRSIVDRVSSNNPLDLLQSLSGYGESAIGLNDILRSIECAKTDHKIKGILLNELGGVASGIATLTEIRNALLDFRLTGKFVISYSDYYGQKPYYLASASDKIYMNPEGLLDLHGLGAEIMFYKGAFDKLGVEAQVIRHGKFKSAVEPYMYDKMSQENREQILAYAGAIWSVMLSDIAEQRQILPDQLNAAINNLQISDADAALALKLVDGLRQRSEIQSELALLTQMDESKNPHLVAISDYSKTVGQKNGSAKQRVAIVYAEGTIADNGRDGIVGKTLAEELRKVRRDSSIKAVVLRVNSPGGSALASEVIWHEMQLLKDTKPLVVSMGSVAASGGYYIACPSSYVMASPTTVTGSIGVFGLMFNAKKFMNDKLGLTVDVAATNDHTDMGSTYRPLSKAEYSFVLHQIEKIYATFTQHVSDGRGIPVAQVDEIGQGRVWSGVDAKRLKLIDEFGGLNAAVEKAVLLASLEDYKLIELPLEKSSFTALMESLGQASAKLTKKYTGNILKDYDPLSDMLSMHGKAQARLPYEVVME
jgi:protease-4